MQLREIESIIATSTTQDEAIENFVRFLPQLKKHTFIFFDQNFIDVNSLKLPDFMQKSSGGILATPVTNGLGYYILNKEVKVNNISRVKTDFGHSFGLHLDLNTTNFLKQAFNDLDSVPCHFQEILKLCSDRTIDLTANPYLIENLPKLRDEKIFNNTVETIAYLTRIRDYGLEKFSSNFPIDNDIRKIRKKLKKYVNISLNQDSRNIARKAIYCILLQAYYISLSSKVGIKKKIQKLLDFCDQELGCYLERELLLCYWYLKDNQDTRIKKFFPQINQKTKEPLDKIRNMSWDLFHLRDGLLNTFDEKRRKPFFSNDIIYVDSLVTMDKGLQEIANATPIRCLIHRPKERFPSIICAPPLSEEVSELEVNDIYRKNFYKRRKVGKKRNIDILVKNLENQLEKLLL